MCRRCGIVFTDVWWVARDAEELYGISYSTIAVVLCSQVEGSRGMTRSFLPVHPVPGCVERRGCVAELYGHKAVVYGHEVPSLAELVIG